MKAQNSSSLNIITFPIYIAKLSTHTVQTIKDINCVKQSSYKLYHITCLEVEPASQNSPKFYAFYAVYTLACLMYVLFRSSLKHVRLSLVTKTGSNFPNLLRFPDKKFQNFTYLGDFALFISFFSNEYACCQVFVVFLRIFFFSLILFLGWVSPSQLQASVPIHTCTCMEETEVLCCVRDEAATKARYWITFLVFSVFPAPDSPLSNKS